MTDGRGAHVENHIGVVSDCDPSLESDFSDCTDGNRVVAMGLVGKLPKVRNVDFCQEMVSLQKQVSACGLPNYLGARIPIYSTLNIVYLESALVNYDDNAIIEFFKFGWPLNILDNPLCMNQRSRNHSSALVHPKAIDKFISKGLEDKSLLGPLDSIPFDIYVFSPLGSVPKSDSDERRTIMDLSFPKGRSVNDVIPKDAYQGQSISLRYPGVDKLVNLVKIKGSGCALFKRDLKSAYRQLLRVDPNDINWLGFSWKGKKFFDLTHPQGGRSAAMCCQRATSGLLYIFKSIRATNEAVNYLDDLGGAERWENGLADIAFDDLGSVLSKAHIEESVGKCCPPSTKMVFLGVLFDTLDMTLSITPERLIEIKSLLQLWSSKTHATKKEVQSIIGKLNFVAACVKPGRIFLARMFAFLRTMKDTASVPLNEPFSRDIYWWDRFLLDYNGVSIMNIQDWSNPDEVLSCDACLSGAGGWNASSRSYFHVTFPQFVIESAVHISCLEILTICVCFRIWAPGFSGKRIQVFCDNEPSVQVIKSGRSRDPFMQACVRELFYLAAINQFEVCPIHIFGVDNRIPDHLSRWHLDQYHSRKFFDLIGTSPAQEVLVSEQDFKFSCPW